MRLLCTAERALFRLVSAIAQILLIAAACAAFYQVIARFILHSPRTGAKSPRARS